MAGLPSKYAKMGFKKGWKAFKASKRGRSVKTVPKRRRNYSRTGGWVARRKQKTTIPVSIVVPLVASVLTEPKAGWNTPLTWIQAIANGQTQYAKNLADCLLNGWLFTDSTGKIDFNGGAYTKMMLVGAAVHWGAGKLGINRAIAKTKIPYIRI